MRFFATLGVCLLLLAGCSDSNQPQPASQVNQFQPASQAAQTASNMSTPPQAPAPMSNITNKDLKTFHQEYDLAKLAYSKHPNSKVAKDTYVQATVRLAEGMMDSDSLLPKQKYPGALKLFREALTADPANQQAQQSKDLIESIYKQMRRPIPQ